MSVYLRNKHSYHLLTKMVSALGWRFWIATVITVAFGLVALLPAQFLHFFVKHLPSFQSTAFNEQMSSLVLFGAFVTFCIGATSLAHTWTQEWLRLRISAWLRGKILNQSHQLIATDVDELQRGEWLTQMSRDINGTENFIGKTLPDIIRHASIIFGVLAILLIQGTWLAAVPIVAAIVLCVLNFRIQRLMTPLLEQRRSLYGKLLNRLLDNLEGWRTIRVEQASTFQLRKFELLVQNFTAQGARVARLFSLAVGSNAFLTQMALVLCLVLAAWSLVQGNMTVQEVLLYPFYLGLFFMSVKGLVRSAYSWNRFLVDGDRLGKMLKEPVTDNQPAPRSLTQDLRAIGLEAVAVELGFRERGLPIEPIEISIPKTGLALLMGHSGCGKSTLLDVLSGIRAPQSGKILLHYSYRYAKVHRYLSKELKTKELHPFVAYLEQRPYLFEGTVRENLVMGSQNHADPRLWKSLQQVGLSNFLESRRGLDTKLVDQGRNLSEGQRYRLALARVLLRETPFLVLDEPFSSLDEMSAEVVSNTLNRLSERKGILISTHNVPDSLSVNTRFIFIKKQARYRVTTQKHLEKDLASFAEKGIQSASAEMGETIH